MTDPKAKQEFVCKCGKKYAIVTFGHMVTVIDYDLMDRVIKKLTEAMDEESL